MPPKAAAKAKSKAEDLGLGVPLCIGHVFSVKVWNPKTGSRKRLEFQGLTERPPLYTPKRSHLKIAVLPQCEAFSADFAGRRSICALRRAKITEGERVVPPVVALHGRFLCTNLGRRSISKGNMATPQLKPCRG